jgi:hypothetical protein
MIEMSTFGDLGLRRSKERFTETQSNRSGHDGKTKIEKIGHARDRTTDEHPCSFDHLRRRILCRSTSESGYRRTRRFRLETSPRSASTEPAIGHDADMTDMAGIPIDTV